MKKRFVVLSIVIMFAVVFALFCKKDDSANDDAKPADQGKVLIVKTVDPGTQGAVEFNHNAHKKSAIKAKKNCKFCHHKGKVTQKCSSDKCHKGKDGEKIMHKKCYGSCHAAEANAPKQADCEKCHK